MQEHDVKELAAFAAELVSKLGLKRVRIVDGTVDIESWEPRHVPSPKAIEENQDKRQSIYSLRR